MKRIGSSFRDPDGYMFEFNGQLLRAVNNSYKNDYDLLISSGLYKRLVDQNLMVPFTEVDSSPSQMKDVYKIIRPERIEFISYPYEWSFDMLKDAAFLTLQIQSIALEYGMGLKDASAFNIQFKNGRPVFIDSLSFEKYMEGRPWIAYRQFCQHFLAPLSLMSRVDLNLNRLFITNIDGISLDFAKKILPKSSRFNLDLYLHIFLHSKAQKNYASAEPIIVKREFSLKSMKTLVEGLRSSIKNQNIKKLGTEWINYTQEGTHKKEYVDFKTNLISKWLDELKPKSLWDIGANTGKYSRIASSKGIEVISFDIDPECVNSNYISVKKNREKITPLLLDILNPSPSIGWGCDERLSFYQRNNPDLVMSLALVHHLAISNNLPFDSIATQFARFSKLLIIEFVPKEDDKVQILLANREDVYHNYNPYEFEKAFAKTFCILEKIKSCANNRIFYLMKKK